MTQHTSTVLHMFAGLGGFALGFQQAYTEFRGLPGRYRTLGGIDIDEGACIDFRALTGAPCTQADIATMTSAQLRYACQGETPDVVALSPPCKGYSSLLPSKSASTEKYQALNRLVPQSLFLLLETFRTPPPKLIVLENVPRITSRGKDLLVQVRGLLAHYGYRVHESAHDCGELGGLAQHRRRYLLVARHEAQVPVFVYLPQQRPVRAVGEVLGGLPMPEDPAAGPLHRLPRLTWKTWIRLALIPAGGDWRDLPDDGPYAVVAADEAVQRFAGRPGLMGVASWSRPASTVTGSATVSSSNGANVIADPRVQCGTSWYHGKYGVTRWNNPARTIIGGPTNGANVIADPRTPDGTRWHRGIYRVTRWTGPSSTVTGRGVASTDGANVVADPRLGCDCRSGTYGVIGWDHTAGAVTASADVHQGKTVVADPRIQRDTDQPDPPPVIIAADGTWHRPLSTLELAALQGLPTRMPDGSPLRLYGRSQARWRERIGNAVPPPAARAIAESLLTSLLAVAAGERFVLGGTPIWVRKSQELHASRVEAP